MLCCPLMHAARALTNLLYPPACPLCEERLPAEPRSGGAEPLCGRCRSAMPRNGPPRCSRCGIGLPGAFDAVVQCAACRTTVLAFDAALAPWSYVGPGREAIRRFKYRRRWRMGRWLAGTMAETARSSFPLDDISLILPVPLHWLKRRWRGWNPAELLADAVARSLEKPCRPRALVRRRWTATQTRLSWRGRFRNVRAAFAARPELVRGRSVLLIDDVLTSGATTDACAAALKAAGARGVFALTAARTPLERVKS